VLLTASARRVATQGAAIQAEGLIVNEPSRAWFAADSEGNVRAIVTPASTIPFCLATDLAPASPTAPDFPWQLCVTIRR